MCVFIENFTTTIISTITINELIISFSTTVIIMLKLANFFNIITRELFFVPYLDQPVNSILIYCCLSLNLIVIAIELAKHFKNFAENLTITVIN